MRNLLRTLGFMGVCLLTMGSAAGQEVVAPTYSNVQVVSVDPVTRLVVIKNAKGVNETFELDDAVAGGAGVKAGDRVIVTVRSEPGRRRISAISKVAASPAPTVITKTVPSPQPVLADAARAEMRASFANQVAALSQQARAVDTVWSSFMTSCDVRPLTTPAGARPWFGLWDQSVKADLSSGFCRDLFNQMVSTGETLKKSMASAEDVARKTLTPEEIRDVRKLNTMDWDGWTLPAPDTLEP
jgi:hypothetical protein